MFYRNLTLMRFSPNVAADLVDRLEESITDHPMRACGPLEGFTAGFVPPIGPAGSAMVLQVNRCLAATVAREEKVLPAAVINDALSDKVQKIAEEEGRKVGGRERKRIKDDLFTELLTRAFTKRSRLSAYADVDNGWLVVDTASRKQAETLVSQWRQALGSFPAIPLAPEEGPRILMADWLANGTLPAKFTLGDECELRDPATASGAIVRARRQDIDAEEIKEHLRNGKQVFSIGLTFDDRIRFVLGEDLSIRKLKFLDIVMDDLSDENAKDAESTSSASFFLMTNELRELMFQLEMIFGLPRPADA